MYTSQLSCRDALNLEHGWARPDDPARAREVAFELSPLWAQHGFHLKAGKEAVHGYVTALIERGAIHDRASLVDALTEAGLEVTRAGKDYVTVRDGARSRDRRAPAAEGPRLREGLER